MTATDVGLREVPPHDLDAERAVIGAVLLDPSRLDAVRRILPEPEAFYSPKHESIFRAFLDLARVGAPVDGVAVTRALRASNTLERAGGPSYLTSLVSGAFATANAERHAEVVAKAQVARARALASVRQVEVLSRGLGSLDDRLERARELDREVQALEARVAPEWPTPTPLDVRPDLPAFPTDALPEWVGRWARTIAASYQVPADLPGSVALGALSIALGRRVVVTPRAGWVEPTNLFVACVLDPANLKSAVVAAGLRPLNTWEIAEAERLKPVRSAAETREGIFRARAKEAERLAADSKIAAADRERYAEEAVLLKAQAEEAAPPPVPSLTSDDVTPEKLGSLIADHAGRYAVASAEGGLFESLARYSGTPNLDVYLKGHAGDDLKVARTGRTGEVVRNPRLTVLIAPQESVVRGLSATPELKGRGLLGRFCWSLPRSRLGTRVSPYDAPELDLEAVEVYARRFAELLRIDSAADAAGRPIEVAVGLNGEARLAHAAFCREVEAELGDAGKLGHMRDWGGKAQGLVLRLAGLIHLATHGREGMGLPIDGETQERACVLGRYFWAHAVAVYGEIGATTTAHLARRALAWIRREGRPEVAERDVLRALHAKAEEGRPALHVLLEAGWLRRAPSPVGAKGGRPKVAYQVHPDALRGGPST